MSVPPRPNTVRRPFRSPVLAAPTRASVASSAVLKGSWAFAIDAIANASTPAISAARDGADFVEEREVIMTSSVVSIRHSVFWMSSIETLAGLAIAADTRRNSVSRPSVPDPAHGRYSCARCDPLLVSLELQAQLVVEDHEVAVLSSHDRLRHDRLHLLCHESDVGLLAAVIAEAIEPKAVVETAEEGDVVLERNIGPPAAASSAAR